MTEFQSVPPYFDASGKEWSLSPSQIETFDEEKGGCQRKWALRYIGGHRPEPNRSAALGSSVHAILEKYLQYSELPDQSTKEGQIATAGLHLLPNPSPYIIVEDSFSFRSPSGYLYGGRVDFQWFEDRPEMGDGVWYVGDHKTTSDFRWMKTPEILQEDTQAIVYAAASLLESRHPEVNLRWVYYRTRGAVQARPSEVTLTAEHVADRFLRIDELGAKIHLALHTVTDPMSMPPNPEACSAFGGCPHQHMCGDVRTTIGDLMSNMPGQLPAFPGAPSLPGAIPAMNPGVPPALGSQPPIPADTANLLAQLAAQQTAAAIPQSSAPVPDVLAALRAAQGVPQASVAAAPPSLPPPMPIAAPPPPPVIPQVPPPASPPSVPVAAPVPNPGMWVDPSCAGNAANFVYPCHCGAQLTGAQVAALPDSGNGERRCPNCNRPIAGASIVCAGLTQPINPPEAAQQVQTAPAAPAPVPMPMPAPPPVSLPAALIQSLQIGPSTITAAPPGPPPNPETPKAGGRGRPQGSKNKPKETADFDVQVTHENPIRVTWGKETYALSQYGSRLEIGPFEREDYPAENESREAARQRLQGELNAWAENERARKVQSFVATLPKT